jgi:BNR repeat-containing family member
MALSRRGTCDSPGFRMGYPQRSRFASFSIVLASAVVLALGVPAAARRLASSAVRAGAGVRSLEVARHADGSVGAGIGVWGPGAWSWFADPRAVRIVGQYDQTYVGWIDWQGAIVVGAYDPQFGVRRTTVIGQLYPDDHASPAILAEPDGRLTVFWSAHNGSVMNYRTTLRPEDISEFGPDQVVSSHLPGGLGFTYPNPVLLPAENDKLYICFGAVLTGSQTTRRVYSMTDGVPRGS